MKFKIQVKAKVVDPLTNKSDYKWRDMQTSSGETYFFTNSFEAHEICRKCYPDHIEMTRVVEY